MCGNHSVRFHDHTAARKAEIVRELGDWDVCVYNLRRD